MTYWDYASLRAGKFKAPLDLERLQSDRDLEFSERSEIQNLVPNRDTGADLHGELLDRRLYYDAALMNGVPNNTAADTTDIDNNDGKDFVGRIFATPFELTENQWLKGLGFGFAGSYGDERGSTTSSYKTYGMSTWFTHNSGVTASGFACAYRAASLLLLARLGFDGRIRAGRAFAEPVHQRSARLQHQGSSTGPTLSPTPVISRRFPTC